MYSVQTEYVRFNTQPPKGGCCIDVKNTNVIKVSTHSRLKAAVHHLRTLFKTDTFQHTAA